MIRIEPLMRNALLTAARAYGKAHGLDAAKVSRLVYGDSKFFVRIARGRRLVCSPVKFDEMMAFFADPKNWPDQAVPPECQQLSIVFVGRPSS